MKKRLIALFTVILLLIGCIGVSAFAEDMGGDAEPPVTDSPENPEPSNPPEPPATEAPDVTAPPVVTQTPVEPTIVLSPPVITKNPGAETVKSGEGCLFIAKADNYTAINWYFTKNGQVIYAFDAATQFPGLKVTGDGTEFFSLESVPDSLNGWNVGAVFTNANGKQGTATCTITVLPTASPSPVVTASPRPTVTPSPTLKPMVTATPAPTMVVVETPAVFVSPSPSPELRENERAGLPIGLLLIAFLLVAALGAAAVFFILYRSGKLDINGISPAGSHKSAQRKRYDDYDEDDYDEDEDDEDDYPPSRRGGNDGHGNGGYRGRH